MYKKVISMFLMVCMLLSIIPFGKTALAAGTQSQMSYQVSDTAGLVSALTEIAAKPDSADNYEIVITNNFVLTQTIIFPSKRNILLRGEGAHPRTITASDDLVMSSDKMFDIPRRQGDGSFVLTLS